MRGLLLIGLMWVLLGTGLARASEFRPAILRVEQTEPGRFTWTWLPALDARRKPLADVRPVFSEHCVAEGQSLDCQGQGLGLVEIAGLDRHPVDAVVHVRTLDGSPTTTILHGERDRIDLSEARPPTGDSTATATSSDSFVRRGSEFVVARLDHALFLLGMVLLVGWNRRLLATVLAFVAGHGLTLTASALGWLTFPAGPVQACIALSVVMVAAELVHERVTFTRTRPAVVAGVLGLLHGVGLAEGFRSLGVSPDTSAAALLRFTLGIELGLLGIVGAAGLVALLLRRIDFGVTRWRTAVAYGAGTFAMAWALERVVAMSG